MKIATRDYSKQQRPGKMPPPRGRAAPPRRGSKKPVKNAALGLPLWAWMVVSLSALVFGGALYYVSRPVAPMDMAPSSEAKKGKAAKTVEIPPKEPSRFAFYEMLPSYEVVVPDDVLNPPKPKPGSARNNLPPETPATATTPPPSATSNLTNSGLSDDLPADLRAAISKEKPLSAADVKGANTKPALKAIVSAEPKAATAAAAAVPPRDAPPQPTAQLASGEQFLIQVAAFRAKADAEQRVAALTLSGLAARVEQVTIDNKDTWYRVRLGPYGNAGAAAAAQQSLKAQGFDGVVMKVKS